MTSQRVSFPELHTFAHTFQLAEWRLEATDGLSLFSDTAHSMARKRRWSEFWPGYRSERAVVRSVIFLRLSSINLHSRWGGMEDGGRRVNQTTTAEPPPKKKVLPRFFFCSFIFFSFPPSPPAGRGNARNLTSIINEPFRAEQMTPSSRHQSA